ncbi:Cilia- and flagella-associated protein 20 [Grifola frondosa]|uniref:Cilia-and flagella-associated protein 20 n=1 Tax=Grifola frondosa TaxID=5627 RepID=A0A1C7LS88_GRIFR|nr:Cilia- and flagella-associated protein 20 [Grifola frondosa]
MFSSAIQPGIVSLFSSTGSDPLSLFSSHSDSSLPSDSFICLLHDTTCLPYPSPPATLISPPEQEPEDEETSPSRTLDQTVLHIQSPTLRSTFIRSPPASFQSADRRMGLAMKHPWIHLQVRNMGREWSFEVGIVDHSGREGIVRCSTFQKQPRLKLTSPPLLHLPLAFPSSSSHPLTAWCTLALHLPSLLPHFSSAALTEADSEEGTNVGSAPVPSGSFAHVSFVKVYATCRLRRIWFSESGPRQTLPREFLLYAAD